MLESEKEQVEYFQMNYISDFIAALWSVSVFSLVIKLTSVSFVQKHDRNLEVSAAVRLKLHISVKLMEFRFLVQIFIAA